jgi:hypothetical protein
VAEEDDKGEVTAVAVMATAAEDAVEEDKDEAIATPARPEH